MNSQEKVLACIENNKTVQEVLVLEPELRMLFEIAADPEPRDNRWMSYEALKRMSKPFVGWDARHEQLRTNRHYEAVIDALDRLLPDNEEMGEIA